MSSRDIRRSRRVREVRARSVPLVDIRRQERERKALIAALLGRAKKKAKVVEATSATPRHLPMTRAECVDGVRPCPFVSCRHHLALEVGKSGSLKTTFPDLEPDELVVSCSLDVGDDGGATLEAVGVMLNLTRERVRQVELQAIQRLEEEMKKRGLTYEDLALAPSRVVDWSHGGSEE